MLLDEQNEKNELLERKFRKVDAELMEVRHCYNNDKDGGQFLYGGGGGNDGRFLSFP